MGSRGRREAPHPPEGRLDPVAGAYDQTERSPGPRRKPPCRVRFVAGGDKALPPRLPHARMQRNRGLGLRAAGLAGHRTQAHATRTLEPTHIRTHGEREGLEGKRESHAGTWRRRGTGRMEKPAVAQTRHTHMHQTQARKRTDISTRKTKQKCFKIKF